MTPPSSDSRGIIIGCPSCDSANRIAFDRLGQQGRCGTCKDPLPRLAQPVEIDSNEAFANLVAKSPLPVIVDFWAGWCGPCLMMAPEFTKAAKQANGAVVLAKVDTERLPDVAARYRIQGIPAFLLFKDGREAARAAGFQPAPKLLEWAASVP